MRAQPGLQGVRFIADNPLFDHMSTEGLPKGVKVAGKVIWRSGAVQPPSLFLL
jgi:hypothetical protein